MIDITKTYRTREGKKARILATDVANTANVVAAIEILPGKEYVYMFLENGQYTLNAGHSYDLFEYIPHEHLKVDQPVWVRNTDAAPWLPRHFSHYADGSYWAFQDGLTSHSARETSCSDTPWKQCTDVCPFQ
ncbi:MAG: hypothetical protein ACD_85C00010G0003 [uncultured bacterium]|nr:MAG: hypothetical protein ACD_85C00010G0003 [uncultured bacterium]